MVNSTIIPVPPAFRKVSTDNAMMGMDEMTSGSSTMGVESQAYCELIKRITAEIEAGVFIQFDMTVWVGRKLNE